MDGTFTYWIDGRPVVLDDYGALSSWCNGAPFVWDLTPEPTVPTVTTQAVDTIVPGGATLNGNITDDGGLSITEHGFCWKAGSDPVDIAGADGYSELGAGAEGAFDQAKTGLTAATLFYVRAYATNSVGDGYGAAISFTTGATIEILRPNAAGDETAIPGQIPSTGAHWDKVADAIADDTTGVVAMSFVSSGWDRDLYNLPSHSVGSGTINGITIYVRAYKFTAGDNVKASLKTGGSVYDSAALDLPVQSFQTVSWAQATNPKTGVAWTWADIDALQIGASIYPSQWMAVVAQVYVEVDYTVASSAIKSVNGVAWANIKSINGVAIANIKAVNGVTV